VKAIISSSSSSKLQLVKPNTGRHKIEKKSKKVQFTTTNPS